MSKLAKQEYIEGYCVAGTTSYSFTPTVTGGNYDTITVYPDANGYWRWNVPKNYPIYSMRACFTSISQSESDKIVSVKFHWNLTKGGDILCLYLFGSSQVSYACTNLRKVEGINFKVSNLAYAFSGCTSLEEVHIIDLVQPTDTYIVEATRCFSECTNLTHIYGLENTSLSRVSLSYAFYYCENLEEIKLGNWVIVNLSRFCQYCRNLHFLKRNGTSVAIQQDGYVNLAFSECFVLEDVDELFSRSNCDIKCQYISSMFNQCHKLKSVNLSGITCQSNATVNSIFIQCRNLEDVVMPDLSALSNVSTSLSSIFRECYSLKLNTLNCPDLSLISASRADYIYSTSSYSNLSNWEDETGKTAFINITHISIPTIPSGTNVSGFCSYARYVTDVISCGDISESMTFANNPLNLASAILILQHLQDVTSYGGKTLIFSSTTKGYINNDQVALALVANAVNNLGWTIALT